MVKIMEHPIKIDDLGVPLFLETPILISIQIIIMIIIIMMMIMMMKIKMMGLPKHWQLPVDSVKVKKVSLHTSE